jgi:hypothetical protein
VSSHPKRGFILIDAASALTTVLAVLCVLTVLAAEGRRLGMLGEDISHLRTIYTHTSAYAADYEDKVWQLSWRANQTNWDPSDPNAVGFSVQAGDAAAALQQTTYLIRRLGDRTPSEMPNLASLSLLPYFIYGNLSLLDYTGDAAPSRLFVSAADARRRWADDPRGYDQGLYTPHLGTGGQNARHPYAATFRMGSAFFDNSSIPNRLAPAASTATYVHVAASLVAYGRPLTDVHHPSQKLFLNDMVTRHFGPRMPYYMMPESRLTALMCDGTASVRAFWKDANLGANPNSPWSTNPPQTMIYSPSAIEPPATPPNTGSVYPGPLWTRMDLQGRDFGGREVYPPP